MFYLLNHEHCEGHKQDLILFWVHRELAYFFAVQGPNVQDGSDSPVDLAHYFLLVFEPDGEVVEVEGVAFAEVPGQPHAV